MDQIFDTLNEVAKKGQPFVVLANEVAGEALSSLILNKVKGGHKLCAVNLNATREFLDDIAIATGGQVVDDGNKEKTFGSAKKIIIERDQTIIVDGGGDKDAIAVRCDDLRKNNKPDRLARLTGGVAVIKVGGNTEAEASERKDRVDDAVCATKAAIAEGIVAGGGMALFYAGMDLKDGTVRRATQAPIRKILENCEVNADSVIKSLCDENDPKMGFDARKMCMCNMIESGIVDPVKVVCSAFKDAASVAALVLNTEAGIVELTKNE